MSNFGPALYLGLVGCMGRLLAHKLKELLCDNYTWGEKLYNRKIGKATNCKGLLAVLFVNNKNDMVNKSKFHSLYPYWMYGTVTECSPQSWQFAGRGVCARLLTNHHPLSGLYLYLHISPDQSSPRKEQFLPMLHSLLSGQGGLGRWIHGGNVT